MTKTGRSEAGKQCSSYRTPTTGSGDADKQHCLILDEGARAELYHAWARQGDIGKRIQPVAVSTALDHCRKPRLDGAAQRTLLPQLAITGGGNKETPLPIWL